MNESAIEELELRPLGLMKEGGDSLNDDIGGIEAGRVGVEEREVRELKLLGGGEDIISYICCMKKHDYSLRYC